MGVGDDREKLAMLTDGDQLITIAADECDDIPADRKPLRGIPSRPIAALIPCNFATPTWPPRRTNDRRW